MKIKNFLIFMLLFCIMSTLIGCEQTQHHQEEVAPISTEEQTYYMRGVWVATAENIDFPSRPGLSAQELRTEIDKIVINVKKMGLTAIFFQIRPMSDAFYNSETYPSSAYLTEKQGQTPPLDVLEYMSEKAHTEGVELHAWINPFRISTKSHNLDTLATTNPAVLYPERVVKCFDKDGNEKGLWFNPALPEVRKMVIDGIKEIVNNYKIDGIHFDDYFYPYDTSNFDDKREFEKQDKDLGDFRRENCTNLIKEIRQAIPATRFGISPCGVWAKKSTNTPDGTDGLGATIQSYFDVYADTKLWVEEKYIDYICPQLYWQTNHSAAPFNTLATWWANLCEKNKIDLYIGLASYKAKTTFAAGEIETQEKFLEYKNSCKGYIYFSYKDLIK